MPQSESVLKLTAALAKAQSKFESISKNRTGQEGNQRFLYSTLSQVLAAVRPALNAEGIFLSQPIIVDANGNQRVTTKLSLGDEFIATDGVLLSPGLVGSKQFGRESTYSKRYDLISTLGVCAEDDDEDAPDLRPSPKPVATFSKPINTPTQAKTVSKPTSFDYGANRNPEITDADIPDFNLPLETEKPLSSEVAAIADHLLTFVPLTAERNTQIQARLKELVSAKTLDRRKLGLFLDARHEGKKAFDVPASIWEDTIQKIESAVTEGEAAIKTLFKRD